MKHFLYLQCNCIRLASLLWTLWKARTGCIFKHSRTWRHACQPSGLREWTSWDITNQGFTQMFSCLYKHFLFLLMFIFKTKYSTLFYCKHQFSQEPHSITSQKTPFLKNVSMLILLSAHFDVTFWLYLVYYE
jgi:hypothetical protein